MGINISTGIVTKKVNGYYSIIFENNEYLCKLKGILKRENDKTACVTGDYVEFSPEELVINKVIERKNLLQRPLVSNIDYNIITFSAKNPNFDFDRFSMILANSFYYNIQPLIVINKSDLLTDIEQDILKQRLSFLQSMELNTFFISTETKAGINELMEFIKEKTCALSGPSGAGKSSLSNILQNEIVLEVGEISGKIERGKHTTKGASLLKLSCGGYIIDTPGFSNIEIPKIDSNEEYIELFPDILHLSKNCGFKDCKHINEPNCHIKNLIKINEFSYERYEFYKKYYPNINMIKKYKNK